MDTGTIVGLAIGGATLLLVIISLIWGPGLWTRREVVVFEEELNLNINPIRRKPSKSFPQHIEQIGFALNFCLKRKSGEKERFVQSAYLQLDKALCQALSEYFEVPPDCAVRKECSPPVELKRNLPQRFHILSHPDWKLKPKMENLYRQLQDSDDSHVKDEIRKVEEIIGKLGDEYEIGWTDTDENTQSKRFKKYRA